MDMRFVFYLHSALTDGYAIHFFLMWRSDLGLVYDCFNMYMRIFLISGWILIYKKKPFVYDQDRSTGWMLNEIYACQTLSYSFLIYENAVDLLDFISTLWNLCLNAIFPMKFLHKLIDSWMLFLSLQLDLELNVFCQNPAFSRHVLQRVKLIGVS